MKKLSEKPLEQHKSVGVQPRLEGLFVVDESNYPVFVSGRMSVSVEEGKLYIQYGSPDPLDRKGYFC